MGRNDSFVCDFRRANATSRIAAFIMDVLIHSQTIVLVISLTERYSMNRLHTDLGIQAQMNHWMEMTSPWRTFR